MRALSIALALIVLVVLIISCTRKPGPSPEAEPTSTTLKNWVCYYGAIPRPEELALFDLAVLSAEAAKWPRPTGKKQQRLGYVSIGEVDIDGAYFHLAKGADYLAARNTYWNSWMVDIRQQQWQQLLFERIIPDVLEAGFDGIFMDTFDSSLELERRDPVKYAGMGQALVDITREIRTRWPKALICQNRGFEILPRTAPLLDFVLIEDLTSLANDGNYERIQPDTRRELLRLTRAGQRSNPKLTVLTLDYAHRNDKPLADEAIEFSRAQGFVPYVSNDVLDEIYLYTTDR